MPTILVIDDNEALRKTIRAALEFKSYHVIESDNGSTGIELARAHLPDLILCDITMEGMDGLTALDMLRHDDAIATIPFILITGVPNEDGLRQGMALGADDYLHKPFSVPDLLTAVGVRLKKAQTLRQQAEHKLAELRANLSLALPHELRTPLNGILGFAELLSTAADGLSPADVASMGQDIFDSARRLQRSIENFLIHAQLELLMSDPQTVQSLRLARSLHVEQLLATVAQNAAQRDDRANDLTLDLVESHVAISQEHLTKLVEELLNNAFEFSKPGTLVEVTARVANNELALTIRDQGCGLSPQQLADIGAYMQFNRKCHEQQGTGLGLTIARRLAELHGGTLHLQSEISRGTTVTVKLPLAVVS